MTSFEIRACSEHDLPAIVDLLVGLGRPAPGVGRDQILDYARRVYFDNPWTREGMASLVSVAPEGRLEGFVGVIPRPMRFKGENILTAIPGNFVVRPSPEGKANPFAAMALLKRFLAGPQDLSYTDTANELSRRLWESSGAVVAGSYTLDWFRPIKPATAVFRMMEIARRSPMPMQGPLFAAAGAADLVGGPMLARMARGKSAAYRLDPFDAPFAAGLLARGGRRSELTPDYDEAGLEWMLAMVDEKAVGRSLRSATLLDERGDRVGAFIYILDRQGTAEALLTTAREDRYELLLHAIVSDAAARGASLVTGMVDAARLPAYKAQRCFLMCNQWTLAHSRRPELVDAMLRARAGLTGLDGERWTRFGDLYELERRGR